MGDFNLLERDFSISVQHLGKGIRISFDLPVEVAGIERIVQNEDGLVLAGFCTALVPIEVNKWDRSIQCHLIVDEPNGDQFRAIHDRSDFWDILVPKKRLRQSSIENLKGIAFVGWWESVNISLGTDSVPVEPNASTLSRITHEWKAETRRVVGGVQAGLPGTVSLLGQVTLEQKPVTTIVRFTPSAVFCTRIDSLFRANVFIYDDAVKIAWLCPTIHLIVLMLRLYISENNYQPSDSNVINFFGEESRLCERGSFSMEKGASVP